MCKYHDGTLKKKKLEISFDLLASTSTTYYHVTTVSGIYADFETNQQQTLTINKM